MALVSDKICLSDKWTFKGQWLCLMSLSMTS